MTKFDAQLSLFGLFSLRYYSLMLRGIANLLGQCVAPTKSAETLCVLTTQPDSALCKSSALFYCQSQLIAERISSGVFMISHSKERVRCRRRREDGMWWRRLGSLENKKLSHRREAVRCLVLLSISVSR